MGVYGGPSNAWSNRTNANRLDASTKVVVQSGLVLNLDAGVSSSYGGSGTTWTDLSGLGNTGTLVNGVGYSSANGGSLSFDGVNDYIDCGTYKFNNSQATIGFWFKPTTSITTSVNQRIWGLSDAFEARWNLDGGRLCFDLGTDQNLKTIRSSWLSTSWYNVVCTWNADSLSSAVYVQGILDSTGNTSNTATMIGLTGNFRINCRSGSTQFFNGNISYFSIYNRVLSATEIRQNFNATRARYGI